MPTKLLIVGALGRMGQSLIRLAAEDPDLEVVAGVDEGDDVYGPISEVDAVIDFTHHSVTLPLAEKVTEAGKVLVIGTTGHDEALREQILSLGKKAPLIFASNYAVGVNALFYLTRKAAEILEKGYDQEVVEMHHRHKKDAPSGTAKTLVEILCDVKQGQYEKLAKHGREGEPGERTDDEIGVHALRGGDVAGEHTVMFAGQGERLELTIKSSNRDTFALGALRAAKWLHQKPAGVYTMFDVLGLD